MGLGALSRAGGATHVGQGSLVVGNRAGTWQRLVVRRKEPAAAHEGCFLTTYECERLRWSVGPAEACVALDVLRADEIFSWLAGEHDWKDLSTRHGVAVMPDEVPTTAGEPRAARIFVIAFVSDATATERGEGGAESEDNKRMRTTRRRLTRSLPADAVKHTRKGDQRSS